MAMRQRDKGATGKETGEIFRVAGPVVTATGLRPRMYDVQFVGEEQLLGEVIQIVGEKTIIQVYEDTSGVKPGEAVLDTGAPLVVELGPGLLGSIYDGVQRPLPVLQKAMGDFILRCLKSPGLTRDKTWKFAPKVKQGQSVVHGDVVGTVQEAKNVEHRIMVPPNFRGGKVVQLKEGSFKVDEVVVQLDNGEQVKMHQTWPVRKARPVKERLMPTIPLVTGQRVLDFLFPIAKGGTAAIPGGFGTGKTVTEQQLSKWCDAQVVIYIGCGERGNEMTEVLSTFPKLIDPYTGAPLMERMSLIANTSNMPVAAREASVYTGMTPLPRHQLASVVQPVHTDPRGLVPEERERGVAPTPIVDPADPPRGGRTRGDRPSRGGRCAPAGPAADPRGGPDDSGDFPPAERLPRHRHVLSAGAAVQDHQRDQEVFRPRPEGGQAGRADEGRRVPEVAGTLDAGEVRGGVRQGTCEDPRADG